MKRVAKRVQRVHAKTKTLYHKAMPEKKSHRVFIWTAFFAVAAILAVQILYPLDRAVPWARLNGSMVGFHQETEIIATVTETFQHTKVRLKTPSKVTNEYSLSSAGAEILPDVASRQLVDYPFWLRLVPFSLLWQMPTVDTMAIEYSPRQLNAFAEKTSKELSSSAQNAGVSIQDGQLVTTQERTGYAVTAADISEAMLHAEYPLQSPIVVKVDAQKIAPEKTSHDFRDVKHKAEEALSRSVIVRAGTQEFVVDAAEKASWLVFGADDDKNTTLVIDNDTLNSSIDRWSEKAGRAAGKTHVTIENGREINRTEGVTGSKIENESLKSVITAYILKGQGSGVFVATMIDVAPVVVYNNTYSSTEDGLRAYVRDKAKHGAWFSIRQLGGNGWSADADASDSVVSASTYKLFVAKRLFDEMNSGKISWNDPMLDTTVSGCFDRMTIASTNPCAVAWLDKFGRQNMNNYVHNLGFSSAVTFVHPQATHVSAGDLTKFMVGLETGTLINGAQRDRLLYSLSHHPYRYGIPTGSKATLVYDKVGFLWDYVHDTAIVRHPRGTYVMTIMTQGKSYAAIASMTRDIERIMYP